MEEETLQDPGTLISTENHKIPRLGVLDSDNDDEDDLFVFGTG